MNRSPKNPFELTALIEALYPQEVAIAGLFDKFFSRTVFDPNLVSLLIRASGDPAQPWPLRRIAVLMLEHEALWMWDNVGFGSRSDWFLGELGLMEKGRVRETVLREGYSTTEPGPFAMELRTRLARLDRIHCHIHGWGTSPDALRDFIHVSDLACKLTLARYLFQPGETAARILDQVRTTVGLAQRGSYDPLSRDLSQTAVFDEMLVDQLRRDRKILWASPSTSSELNSLIEYPLGTVAMVIKPPGSDREFEIKRAGLKGACALDVLFERHGIPVPVPHRMQGASSGAMLEFENSASRRFASIYRGTHGVDPPASRVLGCTPITNVPNGQHDVHILDYLSKPEAFSGDFAGMRDHLKRCVVAYEEDKPRQDLPGEFGWTLRFFNRVVPNQAWLEDTTSFRLDRIATLLSSDGPNSYFRSGLGRDFSSAAERQLADEVLEEVLGVVHPPTSPWTDYGTYVQSALDLPANRAAADRAYLDAIGETGRYWGTLLGTGGFSEGESFVTRNVGLKSRWKAGSWQPRICFMDHDNLNVPGAAIPNLARTVGGMRGDERWVCGHKDRSIMACLKKIYRPSLSVKRRGNELLRKSIEQAFRATRHAMLNSDAVREWFRADYLESLLRRDQVIRLYLETGHSKAATVRWRRKALEIISATVYDQSSVPQFLDFIIRFDTMLRNYAFLVEPEISTRKTLETTPETIP
jgi:hypothetical protein